ncbi:hypothetical protein LAZ67_11001152 [Cordylochernes scorpioides]|uniref:Reverse transcriptase n=1 Tax=Cordylochernes scorpioides TaxID=51811 RepID=A0ABY6KY82_9ARAC|nr:hypothetical protein LAZ67_11001152 [Cordylochernes scorpioides]
MIILKKCNPVIILGDNFLSQNKALINCQNNTLWVESPNIFDQNESNLRYAHIAEDKIIPEYCLCLVKGYSKTSITGREILIENIPSLTTKYNLITTRSLLNNTKKYLTIWILNGTNKPVKLFRNTKIGILSEVDRLYQTRNQSSIRADFDINPGLCPEERSQVLTLLSGYGEMFTAPDEYKELARRTDKMKSEESEIVETYKVNIKLPPFWIERPDIWFHQVEAQFLINGIKTENTKFNYLIAQLEPKYVENLWDIITSKELNKYSEAKERLLRIFKDGESKRIRKLLSGIELGDLKPSQLLQKLKSLATEDLSDKIIKTLWLEKLPQAIQTNFNNKRGRARQIGNRIAELNPKKEIYEAAKPENETKLLLKKIESLEQKIESMKVEHQGRSRDRSSRYYRYNARSRSRSKGAYNPKGPYCYFYYRFGNLCRPDRCTSPCQWKKPSGNSIPLTEESSPKVEELPKEPEETVVLTEETSYKFEELLKEQEEKPAEESFPKFEEWPKEAEAIAQAEENDSIVEETPKEPEETLAEVKTSIEESFTLLQDPIHKIPEPSEQGMDSENTEEVELLYAEQGADSKVEGLVDRVDENPPEVRGYWFPDRPVFGCESEATPVRPVCDGASCRGRSGLSLRRYLKKIPNLLRRIPEIGIKLRKNKYGVLADLRRYFRLMAIKNNDWDYLQFLWKKKMDPDKTSFQYCNSASLSVGCHHEASHSGVANSRTHLVKHQIKTTSDIPIRKNPYRVSLKERNIISDQINSMLKNGIISHSSSPWASPIILVKKKNGTFRFCVDYRNLNSVTVKDQYPLPRIDDCFDSLHGARYFTSLDLCSGYWQVEVEEQDREKTAFITPDGLYQFNVLPFGLCNGPATFERLMDTVLRTHKWKICLCYLDDVIIFSEDLHSHLNRLKTILECLKTAGLTLNASKCRFAYTELLIFGHVVSNEGIAQDPEKIISIRKFPTPRTVKDVRAFLGLCSYYRRFIREFSKVALPLQILTRKNHSFAWGKEQELSFNSLKNKLISPEVLTHYDPNKPIGLHTDASDQGLGAVLVHLNENTKERPISYASRTLQKAETNYSTTEKECLAIIWAIKNLDHIFTEENSLYIPITIPIPPASRPFEKMGIDLMGRFPKSGRGNNYYSRYIETAALPRGTAEEIADFFLQKVVLRHGAPKTVISDRGSCFLSKLFKEVLKICNTLHKKTTSYHPQTNGQTERMNRTLADMMAMYIDERHQNWDEILPFVTFAYNSSIQDTTGYSPYFLIHGREPLTFLDSTFEMPELSKHKDYDEYVSNLLEIIEDAKEISTSKTIARQNKSKQLYDRTYREVKYAINSGQTTKKIHRSLPNTATNITSKLRSHRNCRGKKEKETNSTCDKNEAI